MIELITFASGSIEASHYYSTQELREVLGLSYWSMQRAKDKGLMFTKVGKSDFYLGEDIIRFLSNNRTARQRKDK